jgi:hypothetical protein
MNAFVTKGSLIFGGTIDEGVITSTDNGNNWYQVNSGLPLSSATHIWAMATSGNYLFAGTGYGVYRSSNNGTNWTVANVGITDTFVSAFATVSNNVFVGTNGGIFRSIDNGTTWVDIGSSDLPGGSGIKTIAITSKYIFIYASNPSGQGSIWRRPLSDFGITSVSPPKPSNSLPTSFPNPFSQSTSIKFSSSDHGFAQVSIHNLLGSEVARLFTGTLDAGEHVFSWDAQSMPPGMYVCVVRRDGHSEEMPIMLVK